MTSNRDLTRQIVNAPAATQKSEIEAAGLTPIRSFNQTDLIKDGVAVEIQFGKYSFIGYDLFIKHAAFFARGEIELGVEIVPTKLLQVWMSSGPGYFEKALSDILRQGRAVPAVPLVLIGVEPRNIEAAKADVVIAAESTAKIASDAVDA